MEGTDRRIERMLSAGMDISSFERASQWIRECDAVSRSRCSLLEGWGYKVRLKYIRIRAPPLVADRISRF